MAGDTVSRTGIYSKFTTKVSGSYVAFYTDMGGRLYYERAPNNATYPYCVFQFIGNKPDWYMAKTIPDTVEEFMVQFSIYDKLENGLSAIEGYVKNMHTLYDWCSLTISGYTPMSMQRMSSNPPIEIDDVRQAMTTYRLKIDKD